MKKLYASLIALVVIPQVVSGQLEGSGLQFNVFTDKSAFIPGVPIYLNIVVANVTDHSLIIRCRDEEIPVRTNELAMNNEDNLEGIVDASRLDLQNPTGAETIKTLDQQVFSGGTHLVRIPDKNFLGLEPHQVKVWRKQIPYLLSKAGKYNFVYQLPKLEVLSAGKAAPFDLSQKITVTILDRSEIGTGVSADVTLVPADKAPTGIPTLKWSIKPPVGGTILSEPSLQLGNCRLIIRNPQGEQIREIFTHPYGLSTLGGLWTKPVNWEMPLTQGSFEGFQGNLFPKPGKYIIEISYRDFLTVGEKHWAETDAKSLWYSAQRTPSEGARYLNTNYNISRMTNRVPDVGLWIDFSKTFDLEITPDQFSALKKN